jgi:hypothetical protein
MSHLFNAIFFLLINFQGIITIYSNLVHLHYVKDIKTGKLLLEGPSTRGLYQLRFNTVGNKATLLHNMLAHLHQQLGHRAFCIIHAIMKKISTPVSSNNAREVCEACQRGKSHALSFPTSFTPVKGPLDIIYSNVWCPTPIESFNESFLCSLNRFFQQVHMDLSHC